MSAQDKLMAAMTGAKIPSADETYDVSVPDIPRRAVSKQIEKEVVEIVPSNAMLVNADGTITMGNFTLTGVGLEVAEGATFEEWDDVGGILRRLEGAVQWLLGDWLNHGQKAYGEKYQEALEETDYEYQTLRVYASVAAAYDLLIRNQQVTFSHHRLVVADTPEIRELWLTYAALHGKKLKLGDMRKERGLLVHYTDDEQRNMLKLAIDSKMRLAELNEIKLLLEKLNADKKGNWYDEHLRQKKKLLDELKEMQPGERKQFVEAWAQVVSEMRKLT